MTQDRSAQLRRLHPLLGIASITMSVVFVLLAYFGVAPLLHAAETDVTLIAYGLSALAAVNAVAALLFKARIPPRTLGQTEAEYWSTPPMPDSALIVWCLLEGAAVLAGVA